MIKRIESIKVKDGWLTTKTITEHLKTRADVIKYMKQNGVDYKKHFSTEFRMYGE